MVPACIHLRFSVLSYKSVATTYHQPVVKIEMWCFESLRKSNPIQTATVFLCSALLFFQRQ
jgi:hypothetical protein